MGELPASPTCCLESEVPQLVLGDVVDKSTTERRIKISNGFKPDSFIVDLESFVAGDGDGDGDCTSMNGNEGVHTGAVVDTHLTIKRSISKKDRYIHHFLGYPSASSPTVEGNGGRTTTGDTDQKKSPPPPPQVNKSNSTPKMMISMDHLHHMNNSVMHVDGHQTKLDSLNNNQTSSTWGRRRNSLRPSSLSITLRTGSSSSLFFSPRRVLFFFATLSSMGTILLIYLTLSIVKV